MLMFRAASLLVFALGSGALFADGPHGGSGPGDRSRAEQPRTADSAVAGTWALVSVDNIQADGSRVQLYGPEPQGLLMFDAGGRYSLQIFRRGRPRFASGDKSQGTPAEYAAAVQGGNAHFGRYTVDGARRTLIFHVEHASFPNWEGADQARPFAVNGDELTYTVPAPTTGRGATGEVVWRRIR
jgi:hypothetical protein